MAGFDASAVVQIFEGTQALGSGYDLGNGRVLTARHVVGERAQVWVRSEGQAGGSAMEVAWRGAPEIDVAVLRPASSEGAEVVPSVVWFAGDPRGLQWIARGFPAALGNQAIPVSGGVELAQDPEANPCRMWVTVSPASASDWRGMSGAAVFVGDALFAVLQSASGFFQGQSIAAVPLATLVRADEQLAAAIGAARPPTTPTPPPSSLAAPMPPRSAPFSVYISYSHDSTAHEGRVLELADRLREDGVDARIDRYDEHTTEPRPAWARRQMGAADFVLLVCTAEYHRQREGGADVDPRVRWEAMLSDQRLFESGSQGGTIIAVYFEASAKSSIPIQLRAYTHYRLFDQYEDLYSRLTEQPRVPIPPLGSLRSPELVSRPGLSAAGRPRPDAAPERMLEQERAAHEAARRSDWEERIGRVIAQKIDDVDGLLERLVTQHGWAATAKPRSIDVAKAILAEDSPATLIRKIDASMAALFDTAQGAPELVEAMKDVLFLALPVVAGRRVSPRRRPDERSWSIKTQDPMNAETGMARGDERPMELSEWTPIQPRAYVTSETPMGGAGLKQKVIDMKRDLESRSAPLKTRDPLRDLALSVLKASGARLRESEERARTIKRAGEYVADARSKVDPRCVLTFYTILSDEEDMGLPEALTAELVRHELGGLRVLVPEMQDEDRDAEDDIERAFSRFRDTYLAIRRRSKS